MEDEKETKGLKVHDRRRFDAVGNEREESSSPHPKPAPRPAPSEQPSKVQQVQSDAKGIPVMSNPDITTSPGFDGEEEINFSSFVMSLATQSLMQLGEMKPPPGVEIAVDHEAARQTIDILRMLQKKTVGNLDASESKLVDEILHALRVSYVKATS